MYANGYYIRPSATANNGNALWVCSISGQTGGVADCSELINGVENMQIMYGVDSDGDRSADRYLDASAVANWGQVVSVRVSLLMATPPSAGTLSSTAQTYTYNGTSSTATDRRVRHVYSSTVNVRNRTN
jgi:type IV pilus assembly protein PilW